MFFVNEQKLCKYENVKCDRCIVKKGIDFVLKFVWFNELFVYFFVICEKNNLKTCFEHEWIPGCASGIRQDKYQNILGKK